MGGGPDVRPSDGLSMRVGSGKKDVNCARKVNGNLDTRIQELGRRLAWDIYKHYSRHGKKVDVVGHSMGGQVIRAAITGVNKYGSSSKWPDYLYVEEVVTLGLRQLRLTVGAEQGATRSDSLHLRRVEAPLGLLGR